MPMRQLRSCDFCDEEAAGVYEVVPPELSPTESEQRRVVLCADCRETLEGVLAPLLARLGVEGTGEAETGAGSAPAAGFSPADEDVAPTDSFADDDPRRTSISESERSEIPDLRSGSADVEETDFGDEDAGPDREVDEGALPPLDEEGAPEPSSGEPRPDEGETLAPDDEPAEFRTVMRLLGNREFPVARSEIVEVATNAYDLGEDEVDDILAYAVERDLLEDDGETLRRV